MTSGLFIFLGLLACSYAIIECPVRFDQIQGRDSCLYYSFRYLHHADAVRTCAQLGGSLFAIRSALDNAYIGNSIGDISPYIGVERNSNGDWIYPDGANITYLNWGNTVLSNDTTNICSIMNATTVKWDMVDCTSRRAFICDVPAEKFYTCPVGWTLFSPTASCYQLKGFSLASNDKWLTSSQFSAEQSCQATGAHLVSIHSDAELQFLQDLIASDVTQLGHGAPSGGLSVLAAVSTGLYGTGAVGNGKWTDGTVVDYAPGALNAKSHVWGIQRDATQGSGWTMTGTDQWPRYVCKQRASIVAPAIN
ncbi:unnamed protein product, partial [Mesorhabditis spiculigera]